MVNDFLRQTDGYECHFVPPLAEPFAVCRLPFHDKKNN
jgi:hypothetical protein